MYQFFPYIYLSTFTFFLLLGLGSYALSQHQRVGAKEFALIVGLCAWWVFCQAFELMALTLEAKLFWANLLYLGAGPVNYVFLRLVLCFVGKQHLIRTWHAYLVSILYAGFFLLLFTDPYHGLMRSHIALDTSTLPYVIAKDHGMLFPLFMLLNYTLSTLSLGLLLASFFRKSSVYRNQAILLFLGLGVTFFFNLAHTLKLLPNTRFELTPMLFSLCAVVMSYEIFHRRFLKVTPMARDILLEQMNSGILVLDLDYHIVDINQRSLELFNLTRSSVFGASLKELGYEDLLQTLHKDHITPLLFPFYQEEKERIYEIRKHPLLNRWKKPMGHLIIVDDLTERQKNVDTIIEQQRRLSIAKERETFSKEMQEGLIRTMIRILELHDEYTKGHSESVSQIALQIGVALGLSEEELVTLYQSGMVHDLGKLLVSKETLHETHLTQDDWSTIRMHPVWGYEALRGSPELAYIATIIKHHHERYDGTGYPDALKGEEIPRLSRIIAIADAWDAMIRDRVYRKALNRKTAKMELERHKGTQFDPVIVETFLGVLEKEELLEDQRTKNAQQVVIYEQTR